MPKITYFSIKKLLNKIIDAFQEYTPEKAEVSKALPDPKIGPVEEETRAKFKVSVNDLKIISSALLYYKKFLIKKKDFEKAETVGRVDDRIYQLILSLEREIESIEEEEMVAE